MLMQRPAYGVSVACALWQLVATARLPLGAERNAQTCWANLPHRRCEGFSIMTASCRVKWLCLACTQAAARVVRFSSDCVRVCRLRNACKDNLSCLAGKANKRHTPAFREFMQPVITEMDPEECVEDQYKVPCFSLYRVAAPVT